MSLLSVTLIDVAWGDSIFIETINVNGDSLYGLIDSKEEDYDKSSYNFIEKFFERKFFKQKDKIPPFEFIIASHAHADHITGLKTIMTKYGAKDFWYSKDNQDPAFSLLLGYCNKNNSKVLHHEALNTNKILPDFGDVKMKVLWPPYNIIDNNTNNNSIVLQLELNNVSFILTGDAEREVWKQIASTLPANIKFFKVPHHGSNNGTLKTDLSTPLWLDNCPNDMLIGISSHISPFKHPTKPVIDLFEARKKGQYFRTDINYHLTFETDGTNLRVKYSDFF